MKKKIGIFGSTGSVGEQSLEIIDKYPDKFELVFITGHSNFSKLAHQVKKFKPKHVCISNTSLYKDLQNLISDVNILSGQEGMNSLCELNVDIILNSIAGYKGLSISTNILKNGVNLALSNKESLVQAGSILTKISNNNNAKIIPVDSEHSALWQCLVGEDISNINKLILTGSGGPFRTLDINKFSKITKEKALKHPNWSMGNKITIDSATMMNKGFEVIEAHWLFNLDYKIIDIIIHPESIIHSMVEYIDGSVKAQMSSPTMRIPIQYAFSYPDRYLHDDVSFDFKKYNNLTFEDVDYEKFKCIKFAYDAGKLGGTYPTALNVSNDIAVDMFLNDIIRFVDIQNVIDDVLNKHQNINNPEISDIEYATKLTEEYLINKYKLK